MNTTKPTMTATERESFAELDRLRAQNAELRDHLWAVANAINNGGLKRPSDWAKRLHAALAKAI